MEFFENIKSYIKRFIIKPFALIIEKEAMKYGVEIDFTASLVTVAFGRYDNESPPLN